MLQQWWWLLQQWLPVSMSAYPRSEIAISDQNTDSQYLEDEVLIAHVGNCKPVQTVLGTWALLLASKLGIGNCYHPNCLN